jgi:hypothetical protein
MFSVGSRFREISRFFPCSYPRVSQDQLNKSGFADVRIIETLFLCPSCGTITNDNWPLKVRTQILDGGCQECFDAWCDETVLLAEVGR